MSTDVESPAPSFVATVGGSKPCRGLVLRVVNGNLQLRQPPADIVIIERGQVADFLLALNRAISSMVPGTAEVAPAFGKGEPLGGEETPWP